LQKEKSSTERFAEPAKHASFNQEEPGWNQEPPSERSVEWGTPSDREIAMAAKQKTLDDLFLETLKDMYHAEKQILRALPRMAKAADSDQLRQAFEQHRDETEVQVERLEQVFEMLGKSARGKTCEAIQGIVEEGKEVMDDFKESEALDAGLIAAAQAVEHYEISRYGTLRTWATQLGMNDAAKLLEETLQEEKKTDELLTQLAEAALNRKAA
jgi:ferritin-like metal-binding protein YciE